MPRFRLQRADWQLQPGDRWHAVETLAEGLAWLLPRARRVFATLGRKALEELGRARRSPSSCAGSPARRAAGQRGLGRRAGRRSRSRPRSSCCGGTRSRALFIQASGGELTYAKLAAARELGLPVVMLTRPQPPEGASGSVPEAMAWLAGILGRRTCE